MSAISKQLATTKHDDEGGNFSPSSSQQLPAAGLGRPMTQELVKRAQEGDRDAFRQLVQEMLPQVLALSFRMLNDKAEAEDISQDVLVKLWQNLPKYDASKAKLSTWLYRITANQCLDHLRRKRPDQLDEDYDQPMEADQFNAIHSKEVSHEVKTALHNLPERQRLAIALFHYQGATLAETATIMESSVDAVESLLARARRNLKKSLQPTWHEVTDQEPAGERAER